MIDFMYTSTNPVTVLVIIASTRPGRLGPRVADWFLTATRGRAAELGVRFDLADLAEVALPFIDEPEHPSTGRYVHESTRRWSARVAAADAVVVCTPEYNHAMPATLKNAFDTLSAEWAYKPIGFVGYGNTSAGTRAVHMAKSVAATLGMVPITPMVALRIAEVFAETEAGTAGDTVVDARRDAAAVHVLDELHRFAKLLVPLHADEPMPLGGHLSGLVLTRASTADAGELLTLQRCCWVAEALVNDTLGIAALHEGLDEMIEGISAYDTWVVRDGARIVGSVRAGLVRRSWTIGRLMVAPDHEGRGLGRHLLSWAESQAPEGTESYALSTGASSTRNQRIYHGAGYQDQQALSDGKVVHLVKVRAPAL
jgi:NAD(P)H-dependent FMN reductase/GNAT superfamily N-acetyltransferase